MNEKICPNCHGSGELWVECCNGSNCTCHGEPVMLGKCRVCNGSGVVGDNPNTMANSQFIRKMGCGYLGSSLDMSKRLGE
jgi:hypothetical protein